MGGRKVTIENAGTTYTGQIGTIKSTSLGRESHGVLTVALNVEWPGGGISVGGLALDEWDADVSDRVATAYGLDFILWIMRTVGVEQWEQLPGKPVIVLFEDGGGWGSIDAGIAHITDESQVFVFKDHSDWWKAKGNIRRIHRRF